MGIKRAIEIDGQQVAFKAGAAIPRICRLKFQRICARTSPPRKRVWATTARAAPGWICSLWRCSRTLPASWRSTPTKPLFLLRYLQIGLFLRVLDLLTVGMDNNIFAEQLNDDCKYATLATQENFNRF